MRRRPVRSPSHAPRGAACDGSCAVPCRRPRRRRASARPARTRARRSGFDRSARKVGLARAEVEPPAISSARRELIVGAPGMNSISATPLAASSISEREAGGRIEGPELAFIVGLRHRPGRISGRVGERPLAEKARARIFIADEPDAWRERPPAKNDVSPRPARAERNKRLRARMALSGRRKTSRRASRRNRDRAHKPPFHGRRSRQKLVSRKRRGRPERSESRIRQLRIAPSESGVTAIRPPSPPIVLEMTSRWRRYPRRDIRRRGAPARSRSTTARRPSSLT